MTSSNASGGERSANHAAAFFSGPAEFLDFVLPVFAGLSLGATGAQTGALVAAELLFSLLVRPLAGLLVDRGVSGEGRTGAADGGDGRDRDLRRAGRVASLGALVSLVSFLVYAASDSLPPAFIAAVLGGAGGAFFWVALRTIVAQRAESGQERFAELMEDESAGSWVAFLVGIPLFQAAGYQATFLACAASCLVAAVLLWPRGQLVESSESHDRILESRPGVPAGTPSTPTGSSLLAALRGILALTAVVAFAESIIGLLLILRLQHDLGLELGDIALVYLPGAILLSVAPRPLHRLFRRTPPRRILLIGLCCSAAFAAAMAVRPGALALGVLWILAALCWSLLVPLLERLVAEVSGNRAGQGFGHHQSAELLGAACGSLVAGFLFGAQLWGPATIGAAAVLLAAALYGMRVLRGYAAIDDSPRQKGMSPAMKNTIRDLCIHLAVFVLAQIVFAAVSQSWPWEVITGGTDVTTVFSWSAPGTDFQRWMGSISRIWTIVFVIDVLWSGYRILVPRDRGEPQGE